MLDLIQTRRDLHQIPEIGLEEFKTQAYLLDVIEKLTAGKDFVQVRTWRTGILVYLQGSQPERTIGWRTDIDGLPIVEQTGLPFASQHQGRMHACGHDFHMTLPWAVLSESLSNNPRTICSFCFSLLKKMKQVVCSCMRTGLLEIWLPDQFYGLHVRPDLKVGQIATNTHTLFAGDL